MKKNRSEYELTIEELAREFFGISSEECYSTLKQTVRNKLWAEIWYYCKNCQYVRRENAKGESWAEKYSGIINETIGKCFKSFDPKRGKPFVSYLNAALAKEISREQQKDYMSGMNVPAKTRSLWKHLQNLAEYRGISVDNISRMTELGISIGKSEKEIRNALEWGRTRIISDIARNSNGEEYSLFDFCASMEPSRKEFDAENDYMQKIFSFVESAFCKKQERKKQYLSALLTLHFFDSLLEMENCSQDTKQFLFIHSSLYSELKECNKIGKTYPSQQDIAKRYSRDKTDASRTMGKFLKEVRNIMPKKCQLFTI